MFRLIANGPRPLLRFRCREEQGSGTLSGRAGTSSLVQVALSIRSRAPHAVAAFSIFNFARHLGNSPEYRLKFQILGDKLPCREFVHLPPRLRVAPRNVNTSRRSGLWSHCVPDTFNNHAGPVTLTLGVGPAMNRRCAISHITATAFQPRQYAVWLYFRFPLSFRDVEDLLAQRGIDVSYETVRRWSVKFGLAYARKLRRSHPPGDTRWHLDEVFV